MADLSRFSDYILQVLPDIARNLAYQESLKKQADLYHRNSLAEIMAREASEGRINRGASVNRFIEGLFDPSLLKGQVDPSVAGAQSILKLFPEYARDAGVVVPPDMEVRRTSGIEAMARGAGLRQAQSEIPPDLLATMIQTVGPDAVMEQIAELVKSREAGKARLGRESLAKITSNRAADDRASREKIAEGTRGQNTESNKLRAREIDIKEKEAAIFDDPEFLEFATKARARKPGITQGDLVKLFKEYLAARPKKK